MNCPETRVLRSLLTNTTRVWLAVVAIWVTVLVPAARTASFPVKPGQFKAPLSPPLTPDQALKTFQFAEPGFRIELVASEPHIQDPVAMVFDEAGRLYVAEMRGFTLTMQGKDEDKPSGRISVLEDTDGDGRMDKSTVFLDGLVLPRALCRIRGGLLVAEHDKLWFARDLDGDLRSDTKELVDAEYATIGSVEHRPNGLLLAVDNWIYSGASRKRYRLVGGQWEMEAVEKRGQWGISQDNFGRLYYNFNWSQLHADLFPPGYAQRNPHIELTQPVNVGLITDQRVYPIRPNTAVNRGYTPGVLDKRGYLRSYASACSPLIYRGGLLGPAFQGNAFVCGPCANVVKRLRVTEEGLLLKAESIYPDREFLASTDERFRPVFQSNGPDGALYVVDMYRGIIQQWNYLTPYLREESRLRRLESPVHWGRIYRVVPDTPRKGPAFKPMDQLNNEELVQSLRSPHGWIRDTAQRLLIERGSPKGLPELIAMARHAPEPASRVQALWTLDGLQEDPVATLLPALDDPHPKVQVAAIRILERHLAGKNPAARSRSIKRFKDLASGGSLETRLQIILTLGVLAPESSLPTFAEVVRKESEEVLIREAVLCSIRNREFALLQSLIENGSWMEETPGRALMIEALAGAVARQTNGSTIRSLKALAQASESMLAWQERAIQAGLAMQAPSQAVATNKTRRALSPEERNRLAKGRQRYATYCAACHGIHGKGVKPLGPPLSQSEWVTGVEGRLIRIVLHGMEGPVSVGGKVYQPPLILPSMPSVSTLPSSQIADILTYIRQAWGNHAPPISSKVVHQTRQLNYGRLTPWTAEELEKIRPGENLDQGYQKEVPSDRQD